MTAIAASPAKRMDELAASVTIGAERAGTKSVKILAESAAAGLRARAGFAPARGAAIPAACEPDERPVCSPRAGGILTRLVTDGDWPLVQEWSRLAAERGQRAPEGVVPALLEASATRAELAAAVRPVAGRLGDWLAGLNPEWRKSGVATLPVDLEERWTAGTTAERRAWLALVRKSDPARGITLLRSTWAQDAAGDRQKLIGALLDGLSPADEDFLEDCLKDRSRGVRQESAALLVRMAGSKYVARMRERAAACIAVSDVKKGLLRKKGAKLTIEPPKDWDPAFEADGLQEKPAVGGKRAWWLRQIVECVPPGVWTARTGLDPASLIAAIAGDDYEKELLDAWALAAARHADADWCLALLDQWLDYSKKRSEYAPRLLWSELPPEPCERVVRRMIAPGRVPWLIRWQALGTVLHPWSPAFSLDAVTTLEQDPPKKKTEWWEIGVQIDNVAVHIHPSAGAQLEEIIVKAFGGDLPPSVEKAVGRLRLRAEMHKEFAS